MPTQFLSHTAPVIGYHRAPLSQKFGVPRQPNLVALTSVIEMVAPYDTPAAFVGLEDFSHLWLSWQFHHNHLQKASQVDKIASSDYKSDAKVDASFRAQVRPPRLGGNQKIGVFASRSMYRPSGLGLSVVKLERIEVIDGRVLLIINGADMIDGTPIIDIKPYVAYSDAISNADSGFAAATPTVLTVTVSALAQTQFNQRIDDEHLNSSNKEKLTAVQVINKVQQQLVAADIELVKTLIAQDPRPAYRCADLNTTFIMRYKRVDISFELIEKGRLQITGVQKIDLI